MKDLRTLRQISPVILLEPLQPDKNIHSAD